MLHFLCCVSGGLSRVSRHLEAGPLEHTTKADHLHSEQINLLVADVILYTMGDFDSVSIPRLGYFSARMISYNLLKNSVVVTLCLKVSEFV